MKKVFSIFIVITMFVTIFATSINFGTAFATSDFVVSMGTVDASTSEVISVPISITNVPVEGLAGCDMTIKYDPSQLEYLACESGDIVSNPSVNFASNKPKDGEVRLLFLDYTLADEYIKSDGLLANLNFKVIGSSSISTPIIISNANFVDLRIKRINTLTISGSVNINGFIPSQNLEIQVGSTEGNTGDIVTVPVNFLNVPDKGILACDFAVNYDPEQLEFVDYTVGEIVYNPSVNFAINPQYSDGAIKFLFLDETTEDEHIISDGTFVYLDFKITGTSITSTPVMASRFTAVDTNFVRITPTLVPGSVNITGSIPSQDFKLQVGSTEGNTGDIVTVPVNFLNVPDKGILACDFAVNYDHDQLEFVDYTVGEIVYNPSVNFHINPQYFDGGIKFLFLDETTEAEHIISDGAFVYLDFKITGTSNKSTPVIATRFTAVDTNFVRITPILVPGLVNITGSIPSQDFKLQVGSTEGNTGDIVTVPVNFLNVPDKGILACDFAVNYDPEQLEFVDYTVGEIVYNPSINFGINPQYSDGAIKFLFLDYTTEDEHIISDGAFVYLDFKITGTSNKSTPVIATRFTAVDTNFVRITPILVPGLVNITGSIPSQDFKLQVGSTEGNTGDIVTVPVYFLNIPDKGILACDFAVNYDPEQLEFVDYTVGEIVYNPSVNFHINPQYSDRAIKFLFLDYTTEDEHIISDGAFVYLDFKITGTSDKSTPVIATGITVADTNTVKITPIEVPGSVVITGINPSQNFEVQVGSTGGKAGDIVTVPVNFLNVPDKGIFTCDFAVDYDTTQLEFVDYTVGEIVYNPSVNFFINPEFYAGGIKLLFLDYTTKDEHIISDGTFVNLNFKITEASSTSTTIRVLDTTFGDANLKRITPKVSPGLVRIPTYPVSEPEFKINVGSTKTNIGAIAEVPVILLDTPDTGISLFDMKVTYDPTQLEYLIYEGGNTAPYTTCFNVINESDGKLRILNIEPLPTEDNYVLPDGILVKLYFRAIGSSKETPIQLSDAELGDKDLNSVSAILGSGIVNISDLPAPYFTAGFILPDFQVPTVSDANAGFKVELIGTDLYAITDKAGYFEFAEVPSGEYDIRITKNNYLTRLIENVSIEANIELSTSSDPILMWAGDIEINGSQDGAINLEDIIEICKGFNSVIGNPLYQEHLDINLDGALNMEDIMIVAKHFNKISLDY